MEYPTISLAGRDWPVKPLVVLQLRVVVPALMRLRTMSPSAITQEQYDDLTEVLYQAIAPAQNPPLKRDEFMALPITLPEMLQSIGVITDQAGYKRGAATEPGEVPAETSTGTN